MRRYLLIGAILFLAFVIAFAPAALLRSGLGMVEGVALLNPVGTVWRGSGDLYLADLPAGRVAWGFRPQALLKGTLGYHLRLSGPDHDLTADLAAGPSTLHLSADGTLSAPYLNPWLTPYDIRLSGELRLVEVAFAVPTRALDGDPAAPALAPGKAAGVLSWTGGDLHYRLSGQSYSGLLPPLVASLGDGLEAFIYPEQGQTPLLRAQLLDNGFLKIGITRLLTRLLNNPWPGSDADHEVVLEVEEQIF